MKTQTTDRNAHTLAPQVGTNKEGILLFQVYLISQGTHRKGTPNAKLNTLQL